MRAIYCSYKAHETLSGHGGIRPSMSAIIAYTNRTKSSPQIQQGTPKDKKAITRPEENAARPGNMKTIIS